jgi:hypothetical protein
MRSATTGISKSTWSDCRTLNLIPTTLIPDISGSSRSAAHEAKARQWQSVSTAPMSIEYGGDWQMAGVYLLRVSAHTRNGMSKTAVLRKRVVCDLVNGIIDPCQPTRTQIGRGLRDGTGFWSRPIRSLPLSRKPRSTPPNSRRSPR